MSDNKARLTKAKVAEIAPEPGRQRLVWDTELRGFGLRISPGGAKSYIMQRRVGKTSRRVTIGRADDMTADEARKRAMRLAVEFSDGRDPVAEAKRREARTMTLRDAFNAYIAAPTKKGAKRGAAKKAGTIRDIEKAARRFDDWMQKPVTEITGDMVKKRHAELVARSPAQGNLAMRYLRAVFNHVMADTDDDDPLLKRNPVDRLNRINAWAPVGRAEGHVPDDRLADWIEAAETGLDGLRQHAEKRDALLFILLTGARLSEVIGDRDAGYEPLRWRDVDLDAATVTFRDTKNRLDHLLPLPSQLVARLKERRAYGGKKYVFGDGSDRVPADLRPAFRRIEAATGLHVTAHDLRRTFASVANRLAIPDYTLKALTNHVSGGDVTAGYVQVSPDDLRDAMQKIADYMTTPARRDGGNVVALGEARA